MFRAASVSLLTFLFLASVAVAQAAEPMKPYILAETVTDSLDSRAEALQQTLTDAGFEVVGRYAPYEGAHVLVVTHDTLKSTAAQTDRGGYGAVQRVAMTAVGEGEVQVAYTNPEYVAHAYRLADDLSEVREALEQALGAEMAFGAQEGLTPKELRKYHFKIFMPHFDDPLDLAEYGSHAEAVKAVQQRLEATTSGVGLVYRVDIPGKDQTLFGVSFDPAAGAPEDTEERYQMETVTQGDLKPTPYWPYELLVDAGRVEALNMKFRMAVHFPNLGMGTFMNLMSSPGAVKDALTAVAER